MRLLIVDDEPRLADAVKRGFEAEGFAVDVANDGNTGFWMATETTYDAIVLDIMLPGMNGFKICEGLREKGVWAPILMLTAKDGELDEAEALDLGADDYLSKPFSFVVLVARIKALLRRGSPERPVELVEGDLVLDQASRRCRRGGVQIDLTSREYAILQFLLRRRGEVVTKPEIVEHVWDEHFEGDLNVVEVHVSALRRKIDAPFGSETIHTVRGAGYRLESA